MENIDINGFFDVAVYWFVGVMALVSAYNFSKGKKRTIANGIEVEGIVFDIVTRSGIYGGADHPVIRFVTKEDVWITETYDIGSSFTPFKRGQKVDVIYNSQNPEDFILKADIKSDLKLIPLVVSVLAIGSIIYGVVKLIQQF